MGIGIKSQTVILSVQRNSHIGRLILKNVLYGVKIHDRRYCSKDSVLKYASSEQAIRSLYNETYTALIKQCIREWK